jgi:hypothetical protein
MMGASLEQERRLRDLFDAHYPIAELIEKTGLPIDTIVKVLNAPRVSKQRAPASEDEPVGHAALHAVAAEPDLHRDYAR